MRFRGSLPGRIFLENWGLKLLSLAFAMLLWMFVVGEKRSEMSLAIPLELTGVPDNVVILSRLPETVRVRLNGPRTLLSDINAQQLSVALSLQGIQPGTTTFENLASKIKLPKRIDVTYISPSSITLNVDAKVRRRVKVRPRTRGDPAQGFEVIDVRADPTAVELEGPEKVLDDLAEVPTVVVDVSGLDGSVVRPVELSLPDPSLRRITREPVRLEIVLREKRTQRAFLQIPVGVGEGGGTASPPAVDVKVEGTVRRISALTKADISAKAEPAGKAPSKGRVPVVVQVPEGIQLLSVTPKTVEVRKKRASPARSGSRSSHRRRTKG